MTTTKKYYGPIEAEIDSDRREIVLTVRRGKDPLGQGALERCINWALGRCREKYEDYQIILDGGDYVEGARVR